MELERCSQCGRPKWICQNPDNDLRVDLMPETCQITKAIRDAQRKNKPDDPATDGQQYNHEVYTESQTPLIEFREPFYEEKTKEHELLVGLRRHIPRTHPPGYSPEDEDS